ncbi:MAG TPA: ribonuclease III family protein [Methanomicrobia archaeon]|nr:ribonuclease III family protein [Methanomicrobia archaeon]
MSELAATALAELQRRIGYRFTDQTLLLTALTTSSYTQEHPEIANYQELEFLGDRVISLIIAEHLFAHGSLDEGKMTFLKAEIERNEQLAAFGEQLGLTAFIRATEPAIEISAKVVADVFEAMCGAIYRDSEEATGLREVKQFLKQFDLFTRLQERLATEEAFLPVRNQFENKFREIYRSNPEIRFRYESRGEAHQMEWRVEQCAIKDPATGDFVALAGVRSGQWFKSKKDAETDVLMQAHEYMAKRDWRLNAGETL